MSDTKQASAQEQLKDLNDQMLIRRNKLAQYEEDGIYEVSFETKSYEYEYEVQATTGKILKAEKD